MAKRQQTYQRAARKRKARQRMARAAKQQKAELAAEMVQETSPAPAAEKDSE
jgi:hypothetical protein